MGSLFILPNYCIPRCRRYEHKRFKKPKLTVIIAPRWKKGYAVEVVFVSMVYILFMLGQYLHRRDEKRAAATTMIVDEEKLGEDSVHMEVKT